jgi:Flp pilus assembly protein protease CpaA
MWLVLLIAAAIDYKKRIIPNSIVLMILLTGIWNTVGALERCAGLILPTLPFFLLALKFKNINGGDIKYLAALGFCCGLTELAAVLVFTTTFAMIWVFVRKENSVPLAFVTFCGAVIWNMIKWWWL